MTPAISGRQRLLLETCTPAGTTRAAVGGIAWVPDYRTRSRHHRSRREHRTARLRAVGDTSRRRQLQSTRAPPGWIAIERRAGADKQTRVRHVLYASIYPPQGISSLSEPRPSFVTPMRCTPGPRAGNPPSVPEFGAADGGRAEPNLRLAPKPLHEPGYARRRRKLPPRLRGRPSRGHNKSGTQRAH